MNYELAKQLKDAGFPLNKCNRKEEEIFLKTVMELTLDDYLKCGYFVVNSELYRIPNLEELIDACGDAFLGLHKSYTNIDKFEWYANTHTHPCDCGKEECKGYNWEHETGKTPTEAVAKLYLELNKEAGFVGGNQIITNKQ